MPERQLYGAYCQNNSDQKDDLFIYENFFSRNRICSWTACHNFCTFLQSGAKLGKQLETKDTMMFLQ